MVTTRSRAREKFETHPGTENLQGPGLKAISNPSPRKARKQKEKAPPTSLEPPPNFLSLVASEGPVKGQIFEQQIKRNFKKLTMGRRRGQKIYLKDDCVSEAHAVIEWNGEKRHWGIRDAGSSNGTWVSGLEVAEDESCILVDGDIVELGSTALTVHITPYRDESTTLLDFLCREWELEFQQRKKVPAERKIAKMSKQKWEACKEEMGVVPEGDSVDNVEPSENAENAENVESERNEPN